MEGLDGLSYSGHIDYSGTAYDALAEALGTGGMVALGAVCLVALIACIVAEWKIFEKADEAGWKCLIPIYSTYIFFRIAWGNGWLFLLTLIPLAGAIVALIAQWKLCKAFGHGAGMFLLMLFLPPVAELIIGLGGSRYLGPA